jgi:peptidoglycan/LPS O-acetylase OafA/YrhL
MGLVRMWMTLAVMVDHWGVHSGGVYIADMKKLGLNAGYALMLFNVISGFLITYTLTRNYGNDAAGIRHYYANRAVRVFSLYWPALALGCIAMPAVAWNLAAKDWPDILTSIFLLGSDWRLAFASYPHDHWEALPLAFGPAWTLGAELTFYICAPFIVRRTLVVTAIMIGSLAVRFWFVWQYGAQIQETWTLHFFGSTVCFFMFGILAHRAASALPLLNNHVVGLALMAVAICILSLRRVYTFDSIGFWCAVPCITLALPGIFALTKNIRWVTFLADLTYPMYIVHMVVLFKLHEFFRPSLPVFAAIVIVIAVAVHLLIERPLQLIFRARSRRLEARLANEVPGFLR